MVLRFAVSACALCLALHVGVASATDRGVRWGTRTPSVGPDGVISSTNHTRDSQTAIIVEGGGSTLLPGASITTVGVLNEINVVGDDNLVDATQTGENSGDVTSTVTVGE